MSNEKLIKKMEITIEFLNNELYQDVDSLGYKAFIEGQKYAYKNILEHLYKEKIEGVWSL